MTLESNDDGAPVSLGPRIAADVKCYYCGHISGQVIGHRHAPLQVSNFVPRPGYEGPAFEPRTRLRCERCRGPVFLEDTASIPDIEDEKLARRAAAVSERKKAA